MKEPIIYEDDVRIIYYIPDSYSEHHITNSTLGGLYWHRTNGPAFIDKEDGFISWYVKNSRNNVTKIHCEMCGFDEETTVFWLLKYGDYLPSYQSEVRKQWK